MNKNVGLVSKGELWFEIFCINVAWRVVRLVDEKGRWNLVWWEIEVIFGGCCTARRVGWSDIWVGEHGEGEIVINQPKLR